MGTDLINNIHLEFYGLPGCGKSTVSEIVAKKLESKGYRVVRASAETGNDRNPFIRKIIKLARTFTVYIRHPQFFKRVRNIVIGNGYMTINERIVQEVNIAQKYYYYSKNDQHFLYIWDEGIAQAAVALSVKGCVSGKENEENLLKAMGLTQKPIHIYIVEPIDTVIIRMQQRTTNNSRVEKLEGYDEKEMLLNKYFVGCESLNKQIEIHGNKRKPEYIADEVYKELILNGVVK